MKRAALLAAVSLATLASPPAAQPPAPSAPGTPANVFHAAGLARALRARGDTTAALRALHAGDSLAPGHPAILASLLEHYALANDTAAIVATLRRATELEVLSDPLGLPWLRAWRVVPAVSLAGVAARESARPVVRAETALVIRDRGLVPEALAWDARGGAFYVGSYGRGVILRASAGRAPAPFVTLGGAASASAPAGTAPRFRVLGVKVDSARRLLWAAVMEPSAAAPRGVTGRPGGWASLHAYSLATGRLARRVAPRDSADAAHLLNDMTVSRTGDVYVTDSEGGAVYRVPAGRDTLETIYADDRGFVYPNGIALSADERHLYVAHSQGIAAWALTPRAAPRLVTTQVPAPGFVGNVDGLLACGESLVAIQSAGDHNRVVRLPLSAGGDSVTAVEVLERRHPAYDTPTVGTLVGRDLVYIANSGVTRVRDDGTIDVLPSEPVLLRLKDGCVAPGS